MFIIPNLLTPTQVTGIREVLAGDVWEDGRKTADAGSVKRKNNLQSDPQNPLVQQIQQQLRDSLLANPQFRVWVVPKKVRPVLFNRYDQGMQYGNHMDHAVLPGQPPVRGDVSLTVFLSNPDEYDGGELIIRCDSDDSLSVKLPAGQAVVYSASTMHRVNPVTRGSRIAAVTSVESMIRDECRREIIADMAQVTCFIQDVAANTPEEQRANKIYVNLLRLWSDV